MICPKCGGDSVQSQVFQENLGSATITKTKTKYKEKGHGCLWWLTVGWWWWIVDLLLWIFFFFPRLIIRLFAAPFKKKTYKGHSESASATTNQIEYKTVFSCNDCGNHWKSDDCKAHTLQLGTKIITLNQRKP